jgi:hypothetical protein
MGFRKWDSEETSKITLDTLKPDDYVDSSGTHRPGMDPRKAWYAIVNDFASRSITFSENKFPAISAAAKEVCHHMEDHYKAGLWLGDMHVGLMWSCPGPGATKPKGYVAPHGAGPPWTSTTKGALPHIGGTRSIFGPPQQAAIQASAGSWRFPLTTSTTSRLHW